MAAENRHKRRLTGRGESEQTDVGYRLEFENQVTFDTVFTEEGETGSLAGLRGERSVAESAAAALSSVVARADTDEVGQHVAVGIENHSSIRNLEDEVFTVCTLAVTAAPCLPLVAFALGWK
ncbi:hypothetical protein GCM10020255_091390 [Rhodococcus baikonurensis]